MWVLAIFHSWYFIAALSAIWCGTTVSGPLLIFLHEIYSTSDSSSNSKNLSCISGAWRYPNDTKVTNSSSSHIYQLSLLLGHMQNVLFRSSAHSQSDASLNGLWTCRRNGDFTTAIPVGLYQRGQGELICSLPGIIIVFVQEVFPSMKYPSFPPHSLLTHLPSLWLLTPVGGLQKPTPGQEMVWRSGIISPLLYEGVIAEFSKIVSIAAHYPWEGDFLESTDLLSITEPHPWQGIETSL